MTPAWTVRYLVVDTGTWLPGRQVLISPLSVREAGDKILVDLTQEQVKGSPPVESDKPVNRQQEEAIARYYDQRDHREGPYRWGSARLSRHAAAPHHPDPGRRHDRGDGRAGARHQSAILAAEHA